MDPYVRRAIAERARTQLSLITYQQLRDLEVSPKVGRRLVAEGWLERVGRHTLQIGGVAPTYEGRVMAACLDTSGWASHRTAAVLHRRGPKLWRLGPVEVSVRKKRRHPESPLAVVHTSTNLGPDDLVHVGGIPTTSVARTIFGLAALVPDITLEDVRDVVDVAIRDGVASDAWLWWRLDQLRCRGRNGVSVLEDILSDRERRGRTESWLERAFLDLVEAGGLPLPKVQQRIRDRRGILSRVDFLYEPKTITEVSGYGGHSSRRQVEADVTRRNRLKLLGYEFVEFTHGHIVDDPEYVLTTLAEALGLALPTSVTAARPF